MTKSTKIGVLLWIFAILAFLEAFVIIPHGPMWLGPIGLLALFGLVCLVQRLSNKPDKAMRNNDQ